MSSRGKLFVAMLAAAMILVPGLASAKRTLQLESRKFSGADWTAATTATNSTANVLGVRITNTGLTYIEGLVNGVLQDKVLANFLDCTVRQMLDNNVTELSCGGKAGNAGNGLYPIMGCRKLVDKTPVECKDVNDYAYQHGTVLDVGGPYEAGILFNSCSTLGAISIPMVGTICLAIRIANIDPYGSNDNKIIDFRQIVSGGAAGAGTPYLRMRALDKTTPHTEDDTMDVLVHLDSIMVDLKVEPPFGLTDIYPTHSDGSAYKGYDASQDYSNYVKAWGRITIPSVEVALSIRAVGRYDDYGGDGTKSPHLRDLGLDLFGLYMDLGLEYVLVPGPYCNSYIDENRLTWNWQYKCAAPCQAAEQGLTNCRPICNTALTAGNFCQAPNIEGDTTDPTGEVAGCNRANIDATWPGSKIATNCDDPVLPNSEMIADVIPFLDAHLTMVATNMFSGTRAWPYLDWYIGPTRLVSLNPLLECLSIDNPLTIETDLIMINMGFNTEFWADPAGLIIPGDIAMDFQEYSNPKGDNKNFQPMTSCVEVRSFSTPVTSMSRPVSGGAECAKGAPCNNFINYGTAAIASNGGVCSNVVGVDRWCPMMGNCPAGVAPNNFCNGSPSIDSYHIGIGVHQNMISSIIYDAITTGILCLWIDKEVINRDLKNLSKSGLDVTSMLGSMGGGLNVMGLLGQVFTTDIFALMVPDLSLYWPSADMAIEIVPAVTYPRANTLYPPTGVKQNSTRGSAPLAGYPEPFTNEPPYAKVGKLELNYRYFVPGQAAGSSVMYHGPVTTNDLTIVVPHLNLNFYIYNKNQTSLYYRFNKAYNNQMQANVSTGVGDNSLYNGKRYSVTPLGTPMRAFGLDLGATVGVDLNLLNKGTVDYVFDFYTGGSNTPGTFPRRQTTASPSGDLVPGYHKIGWDLANNRWAKSQGGWNAATRQYKFPAYTYAGGIQMQTGRIIDVTAIVDPDVRFYLEYYEAIPAWAPTQAKYPDFYNDVLGNLLPTLLSGLISVDLAAGFDIGRIINTPFAINGTNAPPFYGAANGSGIFPAGPNTDKLALTPTWPRNIDWSTGTDNGPRNLGLNDPDWLGIFISLQGQLSAKALLAIAAPLLSGFTSGGGTSSITSSFGLGSMGGGTTMNIMNVNVNDVLGALGASLGGIGSLVGLGTRPACALFSDVPPTNIDDSHSGHYSWSPCSPFSPAYYEMMANYYPPETTIHQPTAVDARGTLISFDATDDKDSDGKIRFSYRLDGGFWSPWSTQRYAAVKGLLEGQHLFEVRSLDTDSNIEPTPAQIVFQVDSIPPTISLSGNVHGSSATFVADVRDFQTKPEEIQIAYRLDDGSWSEYAASKKIELAYLSDGTHTIGVKAMDKNHNEAIATQAFNVTPETTFGCSTVPTSGSALLFLLFVPGYLVLRRRIGR
ncbi:MAG: hypothetical protein PHE84_06025 [bacterium]|nr:hypothetical protein [bacterium]